MIARTAALAFALLAVVPSAASALPGQSIARFRTWAAQRPALRGLEARTDEMSRRPAFALRTADHGIAWSVDVATDGTSIESERLAVSDAGGKLGSAPIRQDGTGYGYQFFKSLYGAPVAADFRAARLVATITDPTNHVVTKFLRGVRFGYTLSAGSIELATHAVFTANLAQVRRCTAHPENCSE